MFPTQHYQNGGLLTNGDAETNVPGLYAAGEVGGGVHGRNRLGANSLVDIFVFGRKAGLHAARVAKEVTVGRLTLEHVRAHEEELRRAGIETGRVSPVLLPDYTRPETRTRRVG
jgi:succinate dehydrogenase / fumarate reductase flavoprotein subunit